MLKLQYIIGLFIFAMGFQVQASKSRLEALGQDNRGSLYLKDDRNIFYNPSYVNDIEEALFFEWGNNAADNDTQATPRADGGYFEKWKNYKVGVYLGDEPFTAVRDALGANFMSQENSVTAFLAGRSSKIKWGGSLLYSSNNDDSGIDRKENSLILSGGAQFNKRLSGYLSYHITNKAEGANFDNDELDYSGAFSLGGKYRLTKSKTLFFQYANAGGKNKAAGADDAIDISSITLGVSRQKELANGFMFYSIAYEDSKVDQKDADVETNIKNLPFVIGLETKVWDWMLLRTSLTQNVLLSETTTKTAGGKTTESNQDSTVIGAGTAFLINKDLTIDSSLTTSGANINTDNMITRVSLTYKL